MRSKAEEEAVEDEVALQLPPYQQSFSTTLQSYKLSQVYTKSSDTSRFKDLLGVGFWHLCVFSTPPASVKFIPPQVPPLLLSTAQQHQS